MRRVFATLGSLLLLVTGCGYTLQYEENPLFERYGVRKIYVQPLLNDTFKPGVENVVYNELLRVIAANRRVEITSSMQDADAVLMGSVGLADYYVGGMTTANQLFPSDSRIRNFERPSKNIVVASQYTAVLVASFSLVTVQKKTSPVPSKTLWSGSFSRSQTFPGNNQLGEFGTTSSLLNESEFDRALRELSQSVMASLHESMLAQF